MFSIYYVGTVKHITIIFAREPIFPACKYPGDCELQCVGNKNVRNVDVRCKCIFAHLSKRRVEN